MTPVENLKKEFDEIANHLEKSGQISMLSNFNRSFRKILLLSAGSYFEHQITAILSEFAANRSNGDLRLINFLQKQAIYQRYHQLFSWGEKDKPDKAGKNANTFWKLFGDEFKIYIESELVIGADLQPEEKERREKINKSIAAFLEIGHIRNILVHSNFADYVYDQKTSEEIFILYKQAEPFLEFVHTKLN